MRDRSVRIFLSSNFRDFGEERALLGNKDNDFFNPPITRIIY